MPEPLRSGQRYMPGLDGLRTLAVFAVIAYHLGFGWASGGLLGVGVFFTLSGYLITDLLLAAMARERLVLADFWLRRARRLLPGLFLMLIVVTLWVWVGDSSQFGVVRGQVISALLYVNNWWQISQHLSYFARFGPPSPLNHLWSLSVEEQFYILWPWMLLLGVHVVRERRRPFAVRPRLACVVLVLALASAIEMAVLFHPSFNPTRVYDATDTRAFGLLLGAALAMVWPSRALTTRVSGHARDILDGLGAAGLVTILLLIWRTNQYSQFIYHGGLVLLSLASVLVVGAVAHPATRLGRALGWGPLRWLGVRSYGIYLWHAPIIVLTTPAASHRVVPLRALAQVVASIGLAALSWRYVEEPVRHGALGRLWRKVRSVDGRPSLLPRATVVGLSAGAVALILVALSLAGVAPPSPVTSAMASISPERSPTDFAASSVPPSRPPGVQRAGVGRASTTPGSAAPRPAGTRAGTAGAGATGSRTADSATAPAPSSDSAPPLRTSCRAVVHIGDSTSEGLISSDYLPDPRQRIPAQYERVGVSKVIPEITGGTSIVETLQGGVNAYQVASGLRRDGYQGCWVIALGTNDTADIYVGSTISLSQRIQRMMSVIGNQPVLWVNAKTLVSSGPYAESHMQQFNQALVQACPNYSHMRVYDWASAAQDKWFIPDGIHYYSPGYAARAHLIANALAEAFPASGQTSGSCVVTTPSLSIPVLGVTP